MFLRWKKGTTKAREPTTTISSSPSAEEQSPKAAGALEPESQQLCPAPVSPTASLTHTEPLLGKQWGANREAESRAWEEIGRGVSEKSLLLIWAKAN